ncbi:MAG: hypothetical protein IT371_29365 [Deltaproteobacteria bacterium]|nr:hypothetical protein [Deltaproteobacteria bacterium]
MLVHPGSAPRSLAAFVLAASLVLAPSQGRAADKSPRTTAVAIAPGKLVGMVFKTGEQVPRSATIVEVRRAPRPGGKGKPGTLVGYAAIKRDGTEIPLTLIGKANYEKDTTHRGAWNAAERHAADQARCVGDVCMAFTHQLLPEKTRELFARGESFFCGLASGVMVRAVPVQVDAHYGEEMRLLHLNVTQRGRKTGNFYRWLRGDTVPFWGPARSMEVAEMFVDKLAMPGVSRVKVMKYQKQYTYKNGGQRVETWPELEWNGEYENDGSYFHPEDSLQRAPHEPPY